MLVGLPQDLSLQLILQTTAQDRAEIAVEEQGGQELLGWKNEMDNIDEVTRLIMMKTCRVLQSMVD